MPWAEAAGSAIWALLAGFAGQRKLIDESTVKQALLELQDEAAG